MDIQNKVIDIIKTLSGAENIFMEDFLQENVGLDSFGTINLLLALEDEFQIEFDESDMDSFSLKTVSDIYELVKKYVGDDYEKIS